LKLNASSVLERRWQWHVYGDNDHTIALELVGFFLAPLISLSVLDKRRKWTKISEAIRARSDEERQRTGYPSLTPSSPTGGIWFDADTF